MIYELHGPMRAQLGGYRLLSVTRGPMRAQLGGYRLLSVTCASIAQGEKKRGGEVHSSLEMQSYKKCAHSKCTNLKNMKYEVRSRAQLGGYRLLSVTKGLIASAAGRLKTPVCNKRSDCELRLHAILHNNTKLICAFAYLSIAL